MTQDTITLLTLPPEIRLQIYNHLFTGRTLRANAFHYPLDDQENRGRVSLQPQSPLLNVLLINKQIHQEALPKFYSLIRFRFERHTVDAINWPLEAILDALPTCKPFTCPSTQRQNDNNNDTNTTTPPSSTLRTSTLVTNIYYAGNSPLFFRSLASSTPFSSLTLLTFDLSWDHIGIDQTNFDRAMKQAIRNREWRHAIKDALEQRFPEGMVEAVFELQKARRRFRVLLHWRLAYRFVEFVGECDLDEWVLRVRDPDGGSRNVYEIRQDPMFYEMS